MPNSLKSLLPCPFCGAAAQLWGELRSIYPHIVCTSEACKACGPALYSAEAAITAWNTRAPIAEGGGDVLPVLRDVLALLKNTKELQGREHVSLGIRFNAAIESLSRQGGEDTARLAMLVDNQYMTQKLRDTGQWVLLDGQGYLVVDGHYDTARAAIDAAIAAAPAPGGDA